MYEGINHCLSSNFKVKLFIIRYELYCFCYVEATHLSDQNYEICFRRESGYCAICFTPSIQSSTATPGVIAQVRLAG